MEKEGMKCRVTRHLLNYLTTVGNLCMTDIIHGFVRVITYSDFK